MADVSIKYKGVEKDSLSVTGTKTCKTAGKYCEADIVVEYTKPTPVLEDKNIESITLGTAITPSTGKDGMSSLTLNSTSTVTIPEGYKMEVHNNGGTLDIYPYPGQGFPNTTTYYGNNIETAQTGLTATLGGQSSNSITITQRANTTINVGNNLGGTTTINRTAGTVNATNLSASNIKSGVNILGVTGTYTGESGSIVFTVYVTGYPQGVGYFAVPSSYRNRYLSEYITAIGTIPATIKLISGGTYNSIISTDEGYLACQKSTYTSKVRMRLISGSGDIYASNIQITDNIALKVDISA